MIQAPSAVTSQAPKRRLVLGRRVRVPAASAISQAAAAPVTGANRPSSTRLAGIRWSGSPGPLDRLGGDEHAGEHDQSRAQLLHVQVRDHSGRGRGASRSVNQSIMGLERPKARVHAQMEGAPMGAIQFDRVHQDRSAPSLEWRRITNPATTGRRRRRRGAGRVQARDGSELPLEVVALGEPAAGGVGLPALSWPTGSRRCPEEPVESALQGRVVLLAGRVDGLRRSPLRQREHREREHRDRERSPSTVRPIAKPLKP